jgi:hypothetical protein
MRSERGQATIMLLALGAAVLAGALVMGAFGQALGAKGRHQRAADLAAMSAARTMSRAYPRLFEAAHLENGAPNPRHLSNAAYVSMARGTAVRIAGRNGVRIAARDVTFPRATYAPTRVTVTARGRAEMRVPGRRRGEAVPVRGRATAELSPSASAAGLGMPAYASGGGYDGPLAYRMGNPNPKWVAPPGKSLHRDGTDLDLGPPAAYAWLAANYRRFGFIKRYA